MDEKVTQFRLAWRGAWPTYPQRIIRFAWSVNGYQPGSLGRSPSNTLPADS